jgi:DNA-binding response OmpR family regulator
MEPALGAPNVQQQSPASQAGPDTRAGGATKAARVKCRVMVVEDDPASRNALVMLLQHFGFETFYATTVAEAMQMLSRRPAVMILDLMLPDGNGASVLEHVRHAGLATRVAIATGAGDWKSMLDEARLKPDAVFLKPIDFPKLVRWLDETCTAAN